MRTIAPGWRVPLLIVATVLLVSSIGSAAQAFVPDDRIDKSGPAPAQIARDLVGTHFLYSLTAAESGKSRDTLAWTVNKGDLRQLVVQNRFQEIKKGASGHRVDEVQALVTLSDGDQIIRGVLAFLYLRLYDGWRMVYVGPRDGDASHPFSFERIRTIDGARIAELSPADPPPRLSRFTPETVRAPLPEPRSEPPAVSTIAQAPLWRDSVRPSAPDQLWGPPPKQVRGDLDGRDFIYFVHGDTAGTWSVQNSQVEAFGELRRFRDIKSATGDKADEIHVMVTLAGRDETIRGPLVLQYKRLGKGWRLSSVTPRDGDRRHDFTFERIRNSDGKVIAEMSQAPPRPDPTPFTPRPKPRTKFLGEGKTAIQAE